MGLASFHENGGNSGSLVGHPVGVVGVDLGDACHLEALLVKGCEGGNQAGEGAADGELGDAGGVQGGGDGFDVLVPNDLVEIDEVVAAVAAVSVGPKGGGVDSLGSKVLDLVGDGVLKGCDFLHGVYLQKCVVFLSVYTYSL